ncbi:glycosyltransferase family 2 protein [Parafilimonas sp.]|uniref:glycosyltransferase family 2 protein n=1 Tax=Parafilimonas sp. TaxID=1969739 RepID=UPI0039E31A62
MRFSFILPVKNGGGYIKECVASILAQTLQDFNLIILENCSTDGTAEWLQALNDERIVIIPADKPLSIEENWARILSVPKNEFMTMTGHDDVFDKNYLQVVNDLINQYPDASLYQTHFRFIDAKGNIIKRCRPMKEKQTATEFLSFFLQAGIDVNGTGFMLRSKDYYMLGGIPAYPNLLFADFELWINIVALSYLAVSSKECFSFRLHQSTTAISADIKMQAAFKQFMIFLQELKNTNTGYNFVITKYAIGFIQFWCKGLAHRLMRTPKEKRGNLSVAVFLDECKFYADILAPGNNYKPESNASVNLAKQIDRFAISRNLFLLFKKIYSKPILS